MVEPQRLIEMQGAENFRDLGGYPALDGQRVAWRRLFRAGSLHGMTERDLSLARGELGIRTVIDLRHPDEIEEVGEGRLDGGAVTVHRVSVLQNSGTEAARRANDAYRGLTAEQRAARIEEGYAAAYASMLDGGGPRLAEAVTILAADDALPAVIHCTAGKDRTGVLAALILSALGVDDAVVVDDYALSEPAMAAVIARLTADGVIAADAGGAGFAVVPSAIRSALAVVRERHGSARDYLLSNGVEERALARLADSLLA